MLSLKEKVSLVPLCRHRQMCPASWLRSPMGLHPVVQTGHLVWENVRQLLGLVAQIASAQTDVFWPGCQKPKAFYTLSFVSDYKTGGP